MRFRWLLSGLLITTEALVPSGASAESAKSGEPVTVVAKSATAPAKTIAKPAMPISPASHPSAKKTVRSEAPIHRSSNGSNVSGADDDKASHQSGATSTWLGAESPELRALREAEKELFPPAFDSPNTQWPTEFPASLLSPGDRPRVNDSGLPPSIVPWQTPYSSAQSKELAWLSTLQLPDIPVRLDPLVVRYLEFFKDDPRGHNTFALFFRRSGRYRESIRRALRRKGLPEDLIWVSMIESGFDPSVRSAAGARGIWQFMPETARAYGLAQDRWADRRLDVQAATEAAADLLNDLYHRLGTWELALAAYDLGYGGMSAIVRRYNTNDFWTLSRIEGALPWETTLYVPKIMATAIVAHNLEPFGFGDITADPPVEVDEVPIPPGVPLSLVATAAGCSLRDLESLNPELRAARTPPASSGSAHGNADVDSYSVKVPGGRGLTCSANFAKLRKDQATLERYVVRFGETIEQIAASRNVLPSKLIEINAIAPGETIRGGTILLVPRVTSSPDHHAADPANAAGQKQTVIVPADSFHYTDRRRIFYRVIAGDTLKEIASAFAVDVDDVRRWNNLDPAARLLEGMTLQVFVSPKTNLSGIFASSENDVKVLSLGSDEFKAYLEQLKGHRRMVVKAHSGETLEALGRRFNVAAKMMERVNRRSRRDHLTEGEEVVVYLPPNTHAPKPVAVAAGAPPKDGEPVPNGPIPAPPIPDLLPQ